MKVRDNILICLLMIAPINVLSSNPLYCSDKKVRECFNLTKQKCVQASEIAYQACSNQFGLKSKTHEEAKNIMNDVGACIFKEFKQITSLNNQILESCSAQILEASDKYAKKLKKRKYEFEKRFHEED